MNSLSPVPHTPTQEEPCECKIVNISTTGCHIITSELHLKCDELKIELPVSLKQKTEDKNTLTLTGKDAWFNVDDKKLYHHGIQFTELEEQDSTLLSLLVNQLATEQNKNGNFQLRDILATKPIP